MVSISSRSVTRGGGVEGDGSVRGANAIVGTGVGERIIGDGVGGGVRGVGAGDGASTGTVAGVWRASLSADRKNQNAHTPATIINAAAP
jgi:hypothetical protein